MNALAAIAPWPAAAEAPAPAESNGDAQAEALLWAQHAAQPAPATREQLVLRYLKLARAIAWATLRRHGVHGVDMDDVLQAAYEGLIQAVDRFQPAHGHRFSAFAGFRIEGAVLNSLASLSEVQQQIAARVRVRRERVASLRAGAPAPGREAAVEALAQVSIGLALGFMLEGTALYEDPDRMPTATADAYASLAWRQAQQGLRLRVRALRDDERRVLEYHYYQGLSFQQVAQLLALTPGRISQLHRQALQTLRQVLGSDPDWPA